MSRARTEAEMTGVEPISRGMAMAAEAVVERAEVMGRPTPPEILEAAHQILREWREQRELRQNPIGNPA